MPRQGAPGSAPRRGAPKAPCKAPPPPPPAAGAAAAQSPPPPARLRRGGAASWQRPGSLRAAQAAHVTDAQRHLFGVEVFGERDAVLAALSNEILPARGRDL